jgi:hypothetical protein
MHERHRGSAFGLTIDSEFPIPGMPPAIAELPATTLELGDDRALEEAWHSAAGKAKRLSGERSSAGRVDRTIDVHPDLGYRLFARYFGSCLVAPDGAHLLCVPPPVASWRWQRFLVGRCLPLAALLRGYEVFHAAGVEIDGGVLAMAGERGAGKTSLALRLALQGATFFTDDVLAVAPRAEGLIAHPGFGVANVRAAEDAQLDVQARSSLGPLLGETAQFKRHYELVPAKRPSPLRSFYLLTPRQHDGATEVARLERPDPRRLLMSAFIQDMRSAGHLARLLDVCAALAATVPVFEVSVGRHDDAAAVAARLRSHAATEVFA